MRYFIYSVLLFTVLQTTAQTNNQRPWDRQMKLKTGSIQITADGFTATTFIEMEFFNQSIAEIEGLFQFQLQPEQIITAFQLDLNGKYRDGSIEEKWKATNAYNRIVGKRIDPALLTKDYNNNYSLRIYPVPARQSRKVTITIQQALKDKNGMLEYLLPLIVNDTVEKFSVSITAYNNIQAPQSTLGLVNNEPFIYSKNNWMLIKQFASVVLNKPVQFEWQLPANPFYCTKKTEGKNYFALRYQSKVDSIYQLHPSTAHVFWDVSSSGSYRNTDKEISFLKQYLSFHKVHQLTLITFNHELLDTLIFTSSNNSWSKLAEHLRSLTYDGGTRLSRLNFSKVKSDVVFLFSDGKSSLGNRLPIAGKKPVFTVSTSAITDSATLSNIAGSSGGTYIQLQKLSIGKAIQNASVAVNYLVDILSSGKSIFESQLNAKLSKPLLIYGTSTAAKDTITFVYGNSSITTGKEQLVLDYTNACTRSAIDRLNMLITYEQIMRHYNWNDILDFGLTEKIVTPYTAYIVLELIDHYIQYNIAPPKDLEEECRQRGYVKKDTRAIRNQMSQSTTDEQLRAVVAQYNQRVIQWDKTEKLMWYQPMAVADMQVSSSAQNTVSAETNTTELQGKAAGVSIAGGGNALQEVVVVGYGVSTKRSLGYAVSMVSSKQIEFGANTSIGQIIAGRVPGVYVSGATGEPGSSPNIRIRGASSFSASAQPLFVLNGMPISGNIDQILNPNDIESISIIRDAAGTAIYGASGANGVIIITTKRGRNYGYNYNQSYTLKNMPDVDYLQEMKQTPLKQKLQKFEQLKEEHKSNAGFYLDMSEHLYQCNYKKEAFTILMNAAELYPNNEALLRAIGFMLQSFEEYAQAACIYEELLEQHPLSLQYYRDLAWMYYRQHQYQKAVDVFSQSLTVDADYNYYNDPAIIKSVFLAELNSITQAHKDSLQLTAINPSLIKPLSYDLRIVVEENSGREVSLKINEPGGGEWVTGLKPSKHGGVVTAGGQYNYGVIAEYSIKNAVKGKYKIWVNYYNGYMYTGKIPSVIRITVYKNFGKPNQTIAVQNVMMDNQYGEIEIGDTSW
ncbi:MAG: TonB-dependent receptor plug domain-containing protein [Chitinophagaceae bacterium]|nr:TonB-dependent receptor plug domain-containing protein [Chitinophagaceae bacterium]